ncbi:MAG: O-antigen ligase family protein [Dethiobacteria bacterium]|jgi:putative inorganic carbon (HCO3(-)) transporter
MQYTLKKQHTLFIFAAGLLLGAASYLLPAITVIKYMVAAVAGLLVLCNPTWGLYLLAGTLPFLPNLSLLLLAGLLAFSFIISRLCGPSKRLEFVLPEPAIVVFIIAIVVFTVISITPAASMREFSIYMLSFAAFFVLVNQLKSKNELYIFLLCTLLAAFIVSLYGIYQFVIGVPVESAWVDAARNPGLSTRIFSFFGNPNVLAEYLIMLIPFGLALVWSVRDYRKKMLLLAMTGTLTLALILTFSRGGWLGLAVGLFFFALLKDRRILFLLFFLVLLFSLVGAVFMPDVFLQRFATIGSSQDTSNIYRLMVWEEALLIIKDFWATGVGLGYQAFRKIYPYYMLTRQKLPYHAHNTYLQFLVETGVVGFFIFLWLIVSVLKKGLQSLFSCRDLFLKNILIAALSAIAAILSQGVVEHFLYMPKIIMLFWLIIAVVFVGGKLSTS